MSSCVLSKLYLLSLFSFHSGPSLALSYTGPNSPSGVSGALNMVRADLTLISRAAMGEGAGCDEGEEGIAQGGAGRSGIGGE